MIHIIIKNKRFLNDQNIKNYSKTILITAGTSKIGKTIVKSLSQSNNIIFTYHSNENEKQT